MNRPGKTLFPLAKAFQVAAEVILKLDPHINKFTHLGSLGRFEKYVSDIDILVDPRNTRAIKYVLKELGDWKRGGDRQIYIDHVLGTDMGLDIFLCQPPAQWGVAIASRLNPVPLFLYGKGMIVAKGYTHESNTILSNSMGGTKVVDIPEESDWFALAEVEFVRPEDRWELTRDMRLI